MPTRAAARVVRLAAALLLGLHAAPAGAQDATMQVGDLRVSLVGLLQTQLVATSVDSVDAEVRLRRVRLGVDVRVNELVQLRIVPDLVVGEDVQLDDAYLRLALAPAFQLVAGITGRPFGVLDALSAAEIPVIERGARVGGVAALDLYRLHELVAYAGRATGVQAVGSGRAGGLPFEYAAGWFRGALAEDLSEPPTFDAQQLAARVAVRPLPPLQLGVAVSSRRYFDVPPDDATAAPPTGASRRGTAWEVDARWGRFGEPGVRALVVLAGGALDPFRGERYRGYTGWVAWRTRPLGTRVRAVEPVVRVSGGALDGARAGEGGVLLTMGVNLYVAALSRVMLDVERWLPDDGAAVTGAKLQLQVAF